MNRRTFQRLLLSSAGIVTGALAPLLSLAKITVPPKIRAHFQAQRQKRSPALRHYRYRLRFHRKRNVVYFWARVKKLNDVGADVPFRLVVSADKDAQSILRDKDFVSRVPDSHIVRGHVRLDRKTMRQHQPLFCNLVLGDEKLRTKTWRLSKKA
jgi:hypothetical protein